jgi:predicted DsbA family dithiol-disulfide isomerase
MSVNTVVASPTFWVDGYRCSGAQRVEVLSSMVERAKAIRAAQ